MPLHPVRLARDAAQQRVFELEQLLGADKPSSHCAPLTVSRWQETLRRYDDPKLAPTRESIATQLELIEQTVVEELREDGVDDARLLSVLNASRELLRAKLALRQCETELAELDRELGKQLAVKRFRPIKRLGPEPATNNAFEDDCWDVPTDEFPKGS